MIYLDNNASTPLCDEAHEAMLPWLLSNWANPSSIQHSAGREASFAVKKARQDLAEAVDCDANGVVFTSGATEANTLALLGAVRDREAPRRLFASAAEHLSTLTACFQAQDRGIDLIAPELTSDGQVTPAALERAGLAEGDLVSVHWVNNETGVINDVAAIAALAASRGAMVHVDGAQALGKTPMSLRKIGADYVTLSSHKAHGPKGVGALVIKPGSEIKPLWTGGAQERGLRGGTENVAGAVGFAAAAQAASAAGRDALVHMRMQRDRMEQAIVGQTSPSVVIAQTAERAPNTSMISWPTLNGRELLKRLDRRGVAASAASACTMASGSRSHVLTAMGVPDRVIRGAVRFSLSRYTSDEELDAAIAHVIGAVRDLALQRPSSSPMCV